VDTVSAGDQTLANLSSIDHHAKMPNVTPVRDIVRRPRCASQLELREAVVQGEIGDGRVW
jgi:hypothetical protein